MLLTASPRTTLAKHSTGWRVMRLVTDRGGKNLFEGPAAWGKHRELMTSGEKVAFIFHQTSIIKTLLTPRETRP